LRFDAPPPPVVELELGMLKDTLLREVGAKAGRR
jgi:hypothetical protein